MNCHATVVGLKKKQKNAESLQYMISGTPLGSLAIFTLQSVASATFHSYPMFAVSQSLLLFVLQTPVVPLA
jgi:hypothetical protein